MAVGHGQVLFAHLLIVVEAATSEQDTVFTVDGHFLSVPLCNDAADVHVVYYQASGGGV